MRFLSLSSPCPPCPPSLSLEADPLFPHSVDSPDLASRTLPASAAASTSNLTSRVPRRQNSNSTRADGPPSPPPQYVQQVEYQEEFEPMLDGEDEQDKTLYCFCQRVSFGEMIACDAPDCEHEWVRSLLPLFLFSRLSSRDSCRHSFPLLPLVQFHLPCVGLKSIPEGRWFCDSCRVSRLFPLLEFDEVDGFGNGRR